MKKNKNDAHVTWKKPKPQTYLIHKVRECFRKQINNVGLFWLAASRRLDKNNSLQWLLEDCCGIVAVY